MRRKPTNRLPRKLQGINEYGLGVEAAHTLPLGGPVAVFFQQQQPGVRGCLNGAGQRAGTGTNFNDAVLRAWCNECCNTVANVFAP